MDLDKARAFVKEHPKAVLVTQRRDGRPQTSPILAAVDDEGRLTVSSREPAYKVRNLRRDPRASLCFLSDGFFGDWIQVDGTAELISLPDAMDLLIEYYRLLSGTHEDWDDYRAAMEREKRLIIRITIERAGPDHQA
ncbi:MAG: PPOX class F420-dependent oxidoreductase [Actinomycetota bacterium]